MGVYRKLLRTMGIGIAVAVVLVVLVVAFLALRGGAPTALPQAAAPTAVPSDALQALMAKLRELERTAPQASAGDGALARQLYEESMAIAEASGGRPDALAAALEKLQASREAKHNLGLAEVGFAEILRQAALAAGGPSAAAALERSLEYAQKATAQNSMEGEAWAAYAHALVATGSVDDGIAVMNDHAAYQGYRMLRARAEAAIAKGDAACAKGHLEKAMAGCPDAAARGALAVRASIAGV